MLRLSACVNPLPDMSVLGSSNSAANKDMTAKIWTNGDTINCLSRKHCRQSKNCLLLKAVCC